MKNPETVTYQTISLSKGRMIEFKKPGALFVSKREFEIPVKKGKIFLQAIKRQYPACRHENLLDNCAKITGQV